ncbi:MAG TPA: hypothetical protein VIZ58_12850, partial [Thermoanaerobaculia bacterium]
MAKEVRITLTEEQKAKIKAATGKSMGEIRVSSLGNNIALAPGQQTSRMDPEASLRVGDQDAMRSGVEQESLRAGDQDAMRSGVEQESLRAGDQDAMRSGVEQESL